VEVNGMERYAKLYRRGLIVVTFDQKLQQSRFVRRQLIIGPFGRAMSRNKPPPRATSGDIGAPLAPLP